MFTVWWDGAWSLLALAEASRLVKPLHASQEPASQLPLIGQCSIFPHLCSLHHLPAVSTGGWGRGNGASLLCGPPQVFGLGLRRDQAGPSWHRNFAFLPAHPQFPVQWKIMQGCEFQVLGGWAGQVEWKPPEIWTQSRPPIQARKLGGTCMVAGGSVPLPPPNHSGRRRSLSCLFSVTAWGQSWGGIHPKQMSTGKG